MYFIICVCVHKEGHPENIQFNAYLYPTSYTERGCFFFFGDPYLCILYFHFGCLFVICLLILTVYHTFIPNLFLKFSKLNTKPEGTPTPNHRTPFIVGFGGSGIVESISSYNADEQTRALLHKRVVFIADPNKDGSYAEYVLADRRVVTNSSR